MCHCLNVNYKSKQLKGVDEFGQPNNVHFEGELQ